MKADQITERFRTVAGMPMTRQLALLVGLAVSVSIGVAVVLWSQEPAYGPLYTNLSPGDAGEIISALQERGVAYRVDQHNGTVMVPAGGMHETRIALAAAGLPKSGGVGFELMDRQSAFGESEFMESARYQRVLEGELGRTIASLADVQGVRVHLALPKRSLFLRDREKPSASILVNLVPGRTLEPVQVQAIVHLVSSSVPNLERGRVTVIDQAGRLLSVSETGADLEMSMGQFSYARRLEASFSQRVEEILTPILGPGRVRAQVVADVDFTVVESTEETYDPVKDGLRSEQVSEQRSRGSAFAGGVPGALSNQPPRGGALEPDGGLGGGDGSESSSRTATRNYEVDRTIRHVRSPTGVLRRLSVAVVVGETVGVDEEGNPKSEPLTGAQLEDLTALVKKAVGFSEERGDSVHIVSASFQAGADAQMISDPPFWKQPWFWDLLKQVAGVVLIVLLALGVLRPFLRALPEAGRPAAAPGQGALVGATVASGAGPALAAPDGLSPDRVDVSLGAQRVAGQLAAPGDYEQQVFRAQTMIQEDPRLAANLVKEWLANDG